MSPKDWFGVAARALGAWTVIEGLRGFITAFGYHRDWFPPSSISEYYVWNSTLEVFVGVFLLRGTNLLIGFCYPEEPAPASESSIDPGNPDASNNLA
jgi:hypothetical protein